MDYSTSKQVNDTVKAFVKMANAHAINPKAIDDKARRVLASIEVTESMHPCNTIGDALKAFRKQPEPARPAGQGEVHQTNPGETRD